MKTIKQIISDADPRLKGVLVIMIVYVMVMATTVTSGATQEIKGYKETIEIQYQDGGQETKDYLVRQDTVKNVLKELDVTLGNKDTVNKDMSYIVQSKDLLQVNRISEEEVEEVQYVDSQTIETTGLHLFTTEVVQQGQQGQIKNKVKVTYENGKIVKKELTGDNHSCVLRIFKTLQASYVEVIRSFALMSLKASMMDISQIMIV